MFKFANTITKLSTILLTLLFIFSISACQKSDDSSEENGDITISLTDAEGDFISYAVDVKSLTLTKANGTIVEVMPEDARIDFTQYVSMTELLTTATVPAGVYTSATMLLDYSNADIQVEDPDGITTPVSSIKDEDGNDITTLEVSVGLVEKNQLLIRRGVPALLSLDFDLKTSNAVEFASDNTATVTVSPTLTASLEPDLDKVHRVRGPLHSVNVAENQFKLLIKPFFKAMKNTDRHFGIIKVSSDDSTIFTIDGTVYTGADGLNMLSSMSKYSGVIVNGKIDSSTKAIIASEVSAGSSVPGGDMDGVSGTVLSRDGNQLIIKGATVQRTAGSILTNKNVTVTVADTTTVRRQNDASDYSIADISVGQSISLLGTFSGTVVNPQLDASNGYVKLNVTELAGTVVTDSATTSYPLALNLISIDKRRVSLFDFTNTGSTAENNADPENYEIDTGTLDVSALENNSAIKVRGYVNSFGSAPADFVAQSIINPSTLKTHMHTDWKPASETAFKEISESKITLDFSGAGKFHHIGRGHTRVDLTGLATDFSLVPFDSGAAVYVVQMKGSRNIHTTFAAFSADLQAQSDAGNKIRRIIATGTFDSANGEMSVRDVKVQVE